MKCVTKIPGICKTMLLPGGRSLLAVDGSAGNVTLHRIRLEDDQVSLSVAANSKFDARAVSGLMKSRLFITTSPFPVLDNF